jgi:pimeloyl-ACP methyl ester carboxylesterase
VAIMLAAGHPERVGRIVLCDSAGLRPRRRPSYWLRVGVAKAGRVIGLFGAPGRRLQQRLRGRVASTDYLQSTEAMRGTFRKVIAENLADLLPEIAAPTLVIWGERDEDTPLWMGEEMERLIPDAGLVVLAGAGHYAYADAAARFNQTSLHFLCHQPRSVAAQAG